MKHAGYVRSAVVLAGSLMAASMAAPAVAAGPAAPPAGPVYSLNGGTNELTSQVSPARLQPVVSGVAAWGHRTMRRTGVRKAFPVINKAAHLVPLLKGARVG
ncbi:hypothetical protein [Streptomyces sp. NPDC003077]|uniref:hypothetical protein n=1 Tax=Streptomyces sp. NPDC003077 TaxID=3154443 RepID=UPI0033B05630